jgi:hypothetical protein
MAKHTILTDAQGNEVGTVETRTVIINGKPFFEKIYTMNETTQPAPTPPEVRAGRASQWTKEQADTIMNQHVSRGGPMNTTKLAEAYKVSIQTINNLIKGKTKQFRK